MNPNQSCPSCRNSNPSSARFCQSCGTPLAATCTQGRTLLMTSGQGPPNGGSQFDSKAIAERARKAFGAGASHGGVSPNRTNPSNQREDVMLVCDVSGSMKEEFDHGVAKIEALQRASVNLVLQKARIDPRDRVGVVVFNDRAELRTELTGVGNDKATLIQILQDLEAGGGTDITSGLLMAREYFDWTRSDVVRRIILLTDGEDAGDPIPTADDLKRQGPVIDVIGIGTSASDVNEKLLKRVASTIQGDLRYRFIKDHRTLVSHFTSLATKTSTSP